MEFDLSQLHGTVFGEFLKCAMMSDVTNISDYDQSKLDLEVTLNGNKLDFQILFSMFEERLKAIAGSFTDGPSLDETIRRVSVALTAVGDLESSVNCDLDDIAGELRLSSNRISDLADARCHHRSSIGVVRNLELVLRSLESMKSE